MLTFQCFCNIFATLLESSIVLSSKNRWSNLCLNFWSVALALNILLWDSTQSFFLVRDEPLRPYSSSRFLSKITQSELATCISRIREWRFEATTLAKLECCLATSIYLSFTFYLYRPPRIRSHCPHQSDHFEPSLHLIHHPSSLATQFMLGSPNLYREVTDVHVK